MAGAPNGDAHSPARRRLNTWEEIADYLGKSRGRTLTVKTAQRWEAQKKLPVHREAGLVFAYTDELDLWLGGRVSQPATAAITDHLDQGTHPQFDPPRPEPNARKKHWLLA